MCPAVQTVRPQLVPRVRLAPRRSCSLRVPLGSHPTPLNAVGAGSHLGASVSRRTGRTPGQEDNQDTGQPLSPPQPGRDLERDQRSDSQVTGFISTTPLRSGVMCVWSRGLFRFRDLRGPLWPGPSLRTSGIPGSESLGRKDLHAKCGASIWSRFDSRNACRELSATFWCLMT